MPRFVAPALVGVLVVLFGGFASAFIGGPDGFGYRYIDNGEADGPAFAFEDISATGTLSGLSDQDDGTASVPIGFSFTFYGVNYAAVTLSANGNLQFTTSDDDGTNTGLPTADIDGPAIFPFWDDLTPEFCGDIYYEPRGTAPERRFIVQWEEVCHFQDPNDVGCGVTFQVILYEATDEILMQYSDTAFSCTEDHTADNGASASIGIQQNSTVGLSYSVDSPGITAGLAVCFYPPDMTENSVCFSGGEPRDGICEFSIDKANDIPDPGTIDIGDTFTWTLTVNWDGDCDDVLYDVSDDIPDGFDILAVEFTHTGLAFPAPDCNDADPLLCSAQTDAEAGQGVVEIEVMVSAEACGAQNEAVVTPADPAATGDSDTDTVSTSGCGGLTVLKSCPFGAGESEFTISVADAGGAEVAAGPIACGAVTSFPFPPGDYTLSEAIDGPDAEDFTVAIACGSAELVDAAEAQFVIQAGASEVVCVIINSLGEDGLAGLICSCTCCLDLEIDIGNTNTNVIGIENDNDNDNANDNSNANTNDNGNTNSQDQDNAQDQDNQNGQANNITSSPEVNIDFGQ
jgi:hypothetical protein